MAIRIITDSAADFDLKDAQLYHVDIVPMTIQFGSTSYRDGIDLAKPEFYHLLKSGKENPCTAQPAPTDFLRLFEAAKIAGDEVIAILLSSHLSGTYQSALIAKEMCEYDSIYILDSLSATVGIRLLVEYACQLRDQGKTAKEIIDQLEELKNRICIFAVIDTLEYLHRGGRLSGFQAGLGTLTKLKPVVTVRDGKVSIAAKSFGLSGVVKQLLRFLEQHPSDNSFPAYFLYSDDKSREELLLPQLNTLHITPKDLHYCSIGPTIGAHIGPGAFGMAYIEQKQ